MRSSVILRMLIGTMLFVSACQSMPTTIDDGVAVEDGQTEALEPVVEEAAPPQEKVSKVVMWVYKNNDAWSEVMTNEARDIRGEESDTSRCQGAADMQYVGQCLNWSLSVPCETEGETWFYGNPAATTGSVCRNKSGQWALTAPQSFQDHGGCQTHVEEVSEGEVASVSIECNWLSEDRMKKGTSAFYFEPMAQ